MENKENTYNEKVTKSLKKETDLLIEKMEKCLHNNEFSMYKNLANSLREVVGLVQDLENPTKKMNLNIRGQEELKMWDKALDFNCETVNLSPTKTRNKEDKQLIDENNFDIKSAHLLDIINNIVQKFLKDYSIRCGYDCRNMNNGDSDIFKNQYNNKTYILPLKIESFKISPIIITLLFDKVDLIQKYLTTKIINLIDNLIHESIGGTGFFDRDLKIVYNGMPLMRVDDNFNFIIDLGIGIILLDRETSAKIF